MLKKLTKKKATTNNAYFNYINWIYDTVLHNASSRASHHVIHGRGGLGQTFIIVFFHIVVFDYILHLLAI
jgi:hypothetical protein